MDDFKSIFDISKLSDHELGHLEFVLNSPSYEDVFAPYLRGIRNSLNKSLLDPTQIRKDAYPDDFLRGGILLVDGFLEFFKKLIDETQMERIHRTQNPNGVVMDQYNQLREESKMGPYAPSLGHIVTEDSEDLRNDF